MRRFAVILFALGSILVSPGIASADRGVALDIGRLDISQTLTPGGGYRLPPLGVRNPGDQVTSYRIVVSHVDGQNGRPIPSSWFRFEPRKLTLKPGKTQKVQVRLSVPTGADPVHYEGLVAAQIVTKGKGAQVGAAAAAKVTFSVESSTWLGALWYHIRTFFSDHEPWTWLVPALLAMALLGSQLRQRFSFQIARRA
jgi:hypothetical protein